MDIQTYSDDETIETFTFLLNTFGLDNSHFLKNKKLLVQPFAQKGAVGICERGKLALIMEATLIIQLLLQIAKDYAGGEELDKHVGSALTKLIVIHCNNFRFN